MADAVNPSVIKLTQESLGKHISNPSLTPKLLNKPPFKFLHDVINAVITETGFLNGLYTEAELSKDNIKDKEGKISFLQKCIDATIFATGEDLTVRPSKIVSGHEADKTNEFLQALAKAVDSKIDSEEAVQKVLAGEKPSKGKTSKDKPSKSSDKGKGRAKDDKGSRSRAKASDGQDDKRRAARDKKPSKEDGDRGARKKDSKRGSRTDKPSKPGKENAPPAVAGNSQDPAPSDGTDASPPEEKAPDEEVPDGEAPGNEAPNDAVPDEEAPDSAAPGDEAPVGEVPDDEAPGGDAEQGDQPEEEAGVDDQGIGSGGPTSLVGRDVPPPPPADAVDPAILKAMAPDALLEPGGGDQGDPQDHADSGVGSIDSPKSPASPNFDLPVTSPLEDPPKSPSSPGLPAKPGPMKAVHPEGGDLGGPSPELTSASTPAPMPGPSRPPSSQGFVSSRPVSSRGSRPRTARPPSARPAAPRVRERREAPLEDAVRPPTGTRPPALASVIVQGGRGPASADDLADGGDDEFLVADTDTSLLPSADPLNFGAGSPTPISGGLDMDLGGLPTSQGVQDEDVGEGGLLMDQILDVKKTLEDGRQAAFSPETPGHRRVNMGTDGLSDAARRKEREATQQDVNKLAGSIQTLTKAVNPLAKMLDYLQEDLDSMQKELNDWRDENRSLHQTLRSEQSNMASCIEPLTAQLQELDAAILEQQDRISIVKCATLRNTDRIHALLSAVSLGSE